MNVFPHIRSLGSSRSLRNALIPLLLVLPAVLPAQEVLYTAPGIISLGAALPIYNDRYAIKKTDFGFLWLDTTSLQPGLVQVEAKCGTGQPPSDTGIYVIGDCNGISNVSTSGTLVVGRQFSGQCGAAKQGCNGGRVNGTGNFFFRLGTWEYLGTDLADIVDSTQTADLQGRTWNVQALDTGGRNFKWVATGNANSPPTALATATNQSAGNRADKASYYGDKWQLKDASTPTGSITRIDWDLVYNGVSFAADETGDPATEGTVTGYFPCDPSGPVAGNIRSSANCIQSLNLTNPATSKSYRFAMQSANVNGTSATFFVSSPVQVSCPQANVAGYTGFTGTCARSGGTLNVLTGGSADASNSLGNLTEASFDWSFIGSTLTCSTITCGVPAGATSFTLKITYPGGYQATATGNIVVSNLVAAFSIAPNPVLLNGQLTLTNQMQKAATTTLDSVDYLINPGACGTPPPIASNPVGGSFLAGGTAPNVPSNAPSNGTYCVYLKYSFTPQGQPQQTQIVSNAFTATDWQANPLIQISPLPICGTTLCAQIGTQYSLSDVENFPVSPHPAAQWDLSGTPIGTSADASVPISWTPSSSCSNCTLRVTVNGFTATLPVTVSAPVPTSTPPPQPTPTPPPSGSVSVSVSGPTSGSRGVTLSFTATAGGGSPPYSYQWQCDYNPLGGFSSGQQTQTCSWSTSGTHNVKALIRDALGSSALSPDFLVSITGIPAPSSTNTVTGPDLTINQFNGRYSASNGSPITFTASENNAASYSWNFGDGTSATTKSSTKTYTTAGSRAIVLTVTGDEINTSGTASATINLDITGPPPPSVAYTVAGATPAGTDAYEVEALKTVTLTASETKATGWTWDFGDGTPQGTGKSVTKAWSGPGSRTVTLTVTGNGTDTSGSRSATITFNVTPVKFRAMIVPGAAHLDLGTSVWGTDVSVSNPGADTLTITPNFVPYADGAPDTMDVSQIPYDSGLSFQLAPGASWSQVDIVKFLNGGSNKGTLVFKYEGIGDPVVTARVYFASASDPQGASYGAAFPSYKITGGGGLSTQGTEGTEEAVTSEQTLIGLRSNNLYRFRVTLFNADSRAGTFRLTAFDQSNNPQFIKDASGQLVGFREFKIGPFQQASPNDDDLGLKDAATRYVLKASRAPSTSTGTLIAFGTALDRKTSDLVQISDDTPSTVAESGVISYYVAGVSHLDTQRAQWRTDLRIFNKSSSPRILGFEYYFTKGAGSLEQKAEIRRLTIPANGLLTFDDVVDSLMKQDTSVDLTGDTAGILRIFHFDDADSSTRPIVISSRNYDDPSDGSGTAGTQLGVYSSAQTAKPGTSTLVFPGAEDSERFYSVIGLFTPDSVSTTGRISAIGADGKEIGFYDFVLNQQNGFGRFGQLFLKALRDPANPDSPASIPPAPVTIRVTVTQGGRVGGYAVTVDLKTNDLTFIQGRPLS